GVVVVCVCLFVGFGTGSSPLVAGLGVVPDPHGSPERYVCFTWAMTTTSYRSPATEAILTPGARCMCRMRAF
ncbi:hypothetical protein AB0L54_22775, partial [Streptomyces sp. NPDC052196]|uniref:hypothetical protein n=1 Tax=Streptomyces sp. NPDC052196 TaxID=3156691 RepID=UPI003425C75D